MHCTDCSCAQDVLGEDGAAGAVSAGDGGGDCSAPVCNHPGSQDRSGDADQSGESHTNCSSGHSLTLGSSDCSRCWHSNLFVHCPSTWSN